MFSINTLPSYIDIMGTYEIKYKVPDFYWKTPENDFTVFDSHDCGFDPNVKED